MTDDPDQQTLSRFVEMVTALLGHHLEQLPEPDVPGHVRFRCSDCGAVTEFSIATGTANWGQSFVEKCPGSPR